MTERLVQWNHGFSLYFHNLNEMKTITLRHALQFKVALQYTEPLIWRQIIVSDTYSFWDLHVALQDAMGWHDYHLHEFRLRRKNKNIVIGIPDDDFGFGDPVEAGWEIPIKQYFQKKGEVAEYNYDFGDSWEHHIMLEGILPYQAGERYPQCIAGEGICPPEDCGGIPRFENLLEIFSNPAHEEYEEMTEWLGEYAKDYKPGAAPFDPQSVAFDNPKKRWEGSFHTSP